MEVRELANGIHWVGIRDWERRMFDALIPLPTGTTYNSYVIKGEKATALVDTANPGFEEALKGKVEQVVPMRDIDYLVMNHAEPDHAGLVPFVLSQAPRAKLVLTDQGSRLAEALYRTPKERMMIVKDGDRMSLRIESGSCSSVFSGLLVRADPATKLEVHLDTDEGNAADIDHALRVELVRG